MENLTIEEQIGVRELLEIKGQLKGLVRNKSIIKVIDQPAELKIDKGLFKGELQGRLVKVYNNVNEDWIKFCKINNQFKMQDLYSLALNEFVEKYKKALK